MLPVGNYEIRTKETQKHCKIGVSEFFMFCYILFRWMNMTVGKGKEARLIDRNYVKDFSMDKKLLKEKQMSK